MPKNDVAQRIMEDAARWRWLRKQKGWPDSEAGVDGFTPEQFDEMADKAIENDTEEKAETG